MPAIYTKCLSPYGLQKIDILDENIFDIDLVKISIYVV